MDNLKQYPDPEWDDRDFHALILDVVQDSTSNDNLGVSAVKEDEVLPLYTKILKAARRFGEGAAMLSKAFLWSAATGRVIAPRETSPECSKLRDEMKDLLNQLRWLEKGQLTEEDEASNTPQGIWAAQTLATAVRLKILQRAASYCRYRGEDSENSQRVAAIRTMHRFYLNQLSRLQRPPED